MKFTKTIASILTVALCMPVFMCGCNADTEKNRRDHDDEDEKVYELPKDEILFISGYVNGAWGYHSHMTYVLSDGSVYCSAEYFDGYRTYGKHALSDEDRVALLQKYTKPVGYIDENRLLKIYQNIMQIDTDAEFVYEDLYVCDAGTDFVNVNIDGEWIKISEEGDMNGSLDDHHARKADSLIDRAFMVTNLRDSASVYSGSETFFETFECPNASLDNARRIITSEEELRQFEKDTGIKLSEMDEFEYFVDSDYDIYGSVCIGVEIVQYDEYLSLDEVSADAFIVSEEYTGFALIEDPEIAISDDIVAQKTYCYVVQLPAYDLSRYDAFLY